MPTKKHKTPVASINRPKRHTVPAGGLIGRPVGETIVPPGWIKLEALDDPFTAMIAELNDQLPNVNGGGPVYEQIDRPGRVSLTPFRGWKPFTEEIALLFDDFIVGEPVQGAVDMLWRLAGRGEGTTGGKPPLLRIQRGGRPVQSPWVITGDPSFDESQTDTNEDGDRIRTAVTITVSEYVSDTRLATQTATVRTKLKGRKHTRPYTVRADETLITIARDRLGDAGRWVEIAKLNGLRDPRAVRAGALIILP